MKRSWSVRILKPRATSAWLHIIWILILGTKRNIVNLEKKNWRIWFPHISYPKVSVLAYCHKIRSFNSMGRVIIIIGVIKVSSKIWLIESFLWRERLPPQWIMNTMATMSTSIHVRPTWQRTSTISLLRPETPPSSCLCNRVHHKLAPAGK